MKSGISATSVPKSRKKAQASTQVVTPPSEDELLVGSSTQLLPGKKPGRKRKSNPEKVVPTEFPGTAPVKRKPGRPRKNPLPLLRLPLLPLPLLPQPTVPLVAAPIDSGRVAQKSKKALEESLIQAEKRQANQLTFAKRTLKTLKAEFTL